jgi:hypothetical protein
MMVHTHDRSVQFATDDVSIGCRWQQRQKQIQADGRLIGQLFGYFQTGLAVRFVDPPVTKWENLSVGHETGGWRTPATYQWEQMSSTVALLIGSTSSMCRIKGEAAAPTTTDGMREAHRKRQIQREEAVNQQEFH